MYDIPVRKPDATMAGRLPDRARIVGAVNADTG